LFEALETPHVRLFIILALTTGARMSAILETKWDQVALKHKTINFNPSGRNSTSKGRTRVPLNKRALAAEEAAKEIAQTDYVIEYAGEPIKSIKWAVKRAGERAKVPCSPHVFRHTAGVWMAEADVPMQKISQYLGHASTAITEKVYARYSPTFMKDAADALDW
jgi:integrase